MFHVAGSVSPAWERRLVAECPLEGRADGGRDAEEGMGVSVQRWRALMRGLGTHSLNLFITCYRATRNQAHHETELALVLGYFVALG